MQQTRETISDAYVDEQKLLHRNPRYGVASLSYAPLVRSLLKLTGSRSLSDYGAGKCNLKRALGLTKHGRVAYYPYDPAYPEYGPPRPADLVACIDVLEHVEPDLLDALLDDLSSLARKLVLLTVHTGAAKKSLSDGRNAHLIQQPPSWWIERFVHRFELLHVQPVRKGFFVIAAPKGTIMRSRSSSGSRISERPRRAHGRAGDAWLPGSAG